MGFVGGCLPCPCPATVDGFGAGGGGGGRAGVAGGGPGDPALPLEVELAPGDAVETILGTC